MNPTLLARLEAWEIRLRRQMAVRSAVRASFVGAAVAAAYVLAAKWFHWPHEWEAAGAVFVAAPAIAFAVRTLRRIPLADVARAADRTAGTSDRFSTALELHGSEWAELVERDAAAASLPDEKQLFATHIPRVSRWSLVAAAALAAMLFFIPSRYVPAVTPPGTDLKGLEAPPELAAAAEDLRKLGAEDGNTELSDLGKELERIDKEWKEGKIDKKEALAQIGEVREKIRQAREKAEARKEALAKLAEAAPSRDLGDRTATGEGADAADDAAKKLGSSPAEDAKLADALEKAARAATPDKKLAEDLKKAADAARRGDKKPFTEAMKEARKSWNGLSKKGTEARNREKAAKEEARKEAAAAGKSKELDPKLKKELEELLAKNGWNDKEVQEALAKMSKLADQSGKESGDGGMDNEKLKAMIEEMKKMDPAEAKKLAEKLKGMNAEQVKELAKKLENDSKGPASGKFVRQLSPEDERTLGKAAGAAGKAEGKLNGRGTDETASRDEKGDEGGETGTSDEGGPGPGGGHKKGTPMAEKDRKPVEFHDEKVEVPVGPGDAGVAYADDGFTDAKEGTASVPFEKVLVKYRADMEKAMDDEAYPEEYRRAVRDYFDSLK